MLQSGFAGDSQSYYGWDGNNEGNHSLDALKQAILDALMEKPDLDEDGLQTILDASDASPIEKRNIHKDLAFSFFLAVLLNSRVHKNPPYPSFKGPFLTKASHLIEHFDKAFL